MSARLVYELCRMALADQKGSVAVLKAYMDESGVHDDSPVLTVAAYLGRPRQWQRWTSRWNATKRPIKIFHATDAANLHGEFEGWDKVEVGVLVAKLLPIIVGAELPGIVIGIHMDEYRRAIADRDDLRQLFGTPYAACFQWVVQSILNLQFDQGSRERIGFIHECNAYQHEAIDLFNWVKTNGNPQGAIISLQFGDKATFAPLQAADILAYEGNKRLREPSRPERRPWTILQPHVIAAHYGRENMPELINRLEKIKEGRISEIDRGGGWKRVSALWGQSGRSLLVPRPAQTPDRVRTGLRQLPPREPYQ